MFSFKKREENKTKFLQIIGEISQYEHLGGEEKAKIETLLLSEQGNLCPFCERHRSAFEPTIEHFLPNKFFPHLQLDYYNLYVACHKCNQPKGSHLIPAYIFDVRLLPSNSDLVLKDRDGLNLKYDISENDCRKIIPASVINKTPKKMSEVYFSALMEYSTIEITQQNRNEGQSNLCKQRYDIYNTVVNILISKNKEELIRYWRKLTTLNNDYESFITLKLWILTRLMQKAGVKKEDLQ